jgi:hypothetical protein
MPLNNSSEKKQIIKIKIINNKNKIKPLAHWLLQITVSNSLAAST